MVFISDSGIGMKKPLNICLVGLSALLLVNFAAFSVHAKEYSIGMSHEAKRVNAKVVESPEPEIPPEFKDDAFASVVTARFNIQPDSSFTVALIERSGNEEIDRIVLKTLRKWKFQAATLDDEPIASTRKIRVEIEVE